MKEREREIEREREYPNLAFCKKKKKSINTHLALRYPKVILAYRDTAYPKK